MSKLDPVTEKHGIKTGSKSKLRGHIHTIIFGNTAANEFESFKITTNYQSLDQLTVI